ncbi:MAG: helix-turn-helix transcriptional regulator [Lachnospiraceae bacterium]|nr:helix-turn-helix transcriptional regulator [Lachnospiraceae bacterium]
MEQMNTQPQDFLKNLRSLRARTGMNQTEFANKCGINPAQYRRYENGSSIPRIETIAKIASVLGFEVCKITTVQPNEQQTSVDLSNEPSTASNPSVDSIESVRQLKLKSISDLTEILTMEGLGILSNIAESLACNPRFRREKEM